MSISSSEDLSLLNILKKEERESRSRSLSRSRSGRPISRSYLCSPTESRSGDRSRSHSRNRSRSPSVGRSRSRSVGRSRSRLRGRSRARLGGRSRLRNRSRASSTSSTSSNGSIDKKKRYFTRVALDSDTDVELDSDTAIRNVLSIKSEDIEADDEGNVTKICLFKLIFNFFHIIIEFNTGVHYVEEDVKNIIPIKPECINHDYKGNRKLLF